MKRSIILLMALIVLCAMPILASTPEQDMVLIVDEGDGDFSGLEQVSDEQMGEIFGNMIPDDYHLIEQEYTQSAIEFYPYEPRPLTIQETARIIIKLVRTGIDVYEFIHDIPIGFFKLIIRYLDNILSDDEIAIIINSYYS